MKCAAFSCLRVAITGGAATGKSTILAYFGTLGAACFSADDFARTITSPGSPILKRLARLAGNDILSPNGSLRRKELAKRMFGDPQLRKVVESILHPAIQKAMEAASKADPRPIHCFEIPLLIESGTQNRYDSVILCRCGHQEQLRRLTERLVGDEALARRILDAQATDKARRPFADTVVMTNRPPGSVEKRVKTIFANLKNKLNVG